MPRGKPFVPGDPRINRKGVPKRVAGYRQWSAALWANMLETNVATDTGEKPFAVATIEKYMQDILASKDPRARISFMERMYSSGVLDKLDDILANQKTTDIQYLRYLIHLHLFDEQREVLLSKKKQKLLICGRRAGKTETLVAEIVDTAISNSEGVILYISITAHRAYEIIWGRLIGLLDELRVSYKATLAPQPKIEFASGVTLYLRGAGSKDELEKVRGDGYQLVIVDEVQSIKDANMKYLIEEAAMPGLMQYNGTLVLAGTPPRVAGTFIEREWDNEQRDIARFKWNITSNVYIDNHAKALERIRKDRGLKETDPIYRREYLGELGVYDLDALVYRLEKPRNYFTDADLLPWIQSQPRTDIYLTAGLDFGYSDSDAFCIWMYSISKPERFLLYEYKRNREGQADLAAAIRTGLDTVLNLPIMINIPYKDDFKVWADSASPRDIADLGRAYRLPVVAVKSKANKQSSIERLQDEIRSGQIKVREGSIFEDEARQIIFKRNEQDEIVREIDDDFYHPDMADAILYAFRSYWDRSLGVKLPQ